MDPLTHATLEEGLRFLMTLRMNLKETEGPAFITLAEAA